MTLTGEMAIILHYSTEFGSFGGQLPQIAWRWNLIICDKNAHQSIQTLAIYDLWRYSRRFLKMNSLEMNCLSKAIIWYAI